MAGSPIWLKHVDFLGRIVPGWTLRVPLCVPGKSVPDVCIIRPGGLGDLVLMTRAAIDLGLNISSFFWVIERRNAPWLEYLGVPHVCYDSGPVFLRALIGHWRFQTVLNSEQHFCLSTLFAMRLVQSRGVVIGFSSNSRADLYDKVVAYDEVQQAELLAFRELFSSCDLEHAGWRGSGPEADQVPAPDRRSVPEGDYAVVALGGLQVSYKRLSVRNWQGMIQQARSYGYPVYMVGAPVDRAFAEEIASSLECATGFVNLVGRLKFSESVNVIRHAKRLIGVDSGLVHVADFFGVPSDVLFTGSPVQKWRPRHKLSNILDPKAFSDTLVQK